MTIENLKEPMNFKEIDSSQGWRGAMQSKMESIDKNWTYELINLLKGKQPIITKWVYKMKVRSIEKLAKLKARLIAQFSAN